MGYELSPRGRAYLELSGDGDLAGDRAGAAAAAIASEAATG
jgi:hypothetical protein